jgi:multiple sugar transport system permease protein
MQKNAKKGQGKLKGVLNRNISGWVLILPSVLLFTYIIWRPIIIGIAYSFFSLDGFSPATFIGVSNYKDVLTDTNFLQTLWNTVQYVFWSLVIGFPLPFICAVMMNELVHCKSFFKISTYLPVIIPGIATCLIWKIAYMDGSGGLLNMVRYMFGAEATTWLSNKDQVIPLIIISMTWNTFGRTLVMYLSTLQGVNQELYEAARLDGAGLFGRIRYVLFPHMRGVLLLLLINQIIAVFNVTEQPLVMTSGGPNGASMSLGLTNYFYAFKYGQYEKSLALGVITFCLLSVLTFIYFMVDKRIND